MPVAIKVTYSLDEQVNIMDAVMKEQVVRREDQRAMLT